MLIAVASALIVEFGALVYSIYAYPHLWGNETVGVYLFAAGMLIPTFLVVDRLKSLANAAAAPRSLLVYGFIATGIGLCVIPRLGSHGAAAVLIWVLAPQAVLHTMAFRRLGSGLG